MIGFPLLRHALAFRMICCASVGLIAGASISPAFGQASTPAMGFYAVKVAGQPEGGPPARTYVGMQLLPKPLSMDLVEEVDGNTVTIPVSLTPSPSEEYYLHVLAGDGEGFIADITDFSGSDVLCAVDMESWVDPETHIQIGQHPKLAGIFGADNRFGLGSGTSAENADNVVIWDADTQQEKVFYYHSTNERWQEKDVDADANNAVLRYPLGFYIVRRSPETLRIALSGDIASHALLLPVRTGANVFPLPVNLTNSLQNLVDTEGDYAVKKGPNATLADILIFEEPSTGERRGPFYYRSHPVNPGWREIGVNGSEEAVSSLDMLSTLVIQRSSSEGYLRVNGNITELPLDPIPSIPPDPEIGELPITMEFPLPQQVPPGLVWDLETSTDLINWGIYPEFTRNPNGSVTFNLPPGQSRGFYRLTVSLMN